MSDSDDQAAKKKQKIKDDLITGCSKMSNIRAQQHLLYETQSTDSNPRVDNKAAERSRLYRERHREEINQRRREIRQHKQNLHQIRTVSNVQNTENELTNTASNNQLSSNVHTQRQQTYYERHREEINKRKRDSRIKQNPRLIPATAAERNRNYRERKRHEINERRRHSRRREQKLQRIRTECNVINNIDAIEQITEARQNNQQGLNSSNDIKQEIAQNFTNTPQQLKQNFDETKNNRVQTTTAALQKTEGDDVDSQCEGISDGYDALSLYPNSPNSSTAETSKPSAGRILIGNSDRHIGYVCSSCSGEIRGYRYTCVQCPDYDLCAACETKGAHSLHYVLRIPNTAPFSEIELLLNKVRAQLKYGANALTDEQTATADVQPSVLGIKVEVKEELPEPLLTEDGMDEKDTVNMPYTAANDTTQKISINVNSTTTETIHGNTLLIIENPVSAGSVASSSTPLPSYTKRKHGSVASPSTPLPSYTKRKHGSVASPSTPLPSYTKRKHGSVASPSTPLPSYTKRKHGSVASPSTPLPSYTKRKHGSVASPSTPLPSYTKRKHGSVASPSTPLPSYTKRKHGSVASPSTPLPSYTKRKHGSVASPSTPLPSYTKRKHGSVASTSTPLPSYTKRKHGAIINVPAATIDKRIKLEPQEPQASNMGTGTYIDVPITGYVPVTIVPGTVGTSDSAGTSDIDSVTLEGWRVKWKPRFKFSRLRLRKKKNL